MYVLKIIKEDGALFEQKAETNDLLDAMQSFELTFLLYLMKTILGITNDLSLALQRKDQDIINAMDLVKISKRRLQRMQVDGWDSLLNAAFSFCDKNNISIPNMDDKFVVRGRSRRKAPEITNLYFYRVELFYTVINLQLQELNARFNKVNTQYFCIWLP